MRNVDTEQKLSGIEVPGEDGEALEEQYNPLHDFAVFGVGNARHGGNQTLQQKMNLADELSSPSESEDNASQNESKDNYNTKDQIVKDKESNFMSSDEFGSHPASTGSQQLPTET